MTEAGGMDAFHMFALCRRREVLGWKNFWSPGKRTEKKTVRNV